MKWKSSPSFSFFPASAWFCVTKEREEKVEPGPRDELSIKLTSPATRVIASHVTFDSTTDGLTDKTGPVIPQWLILSKMMEQQTLVLPGCDGGGDNDADDADDADDDECALVSK